MNVVKLEEINSTTGSLYIDVKDICVPLIPATHRDREASQKIAFKFIGSFSNSHEKAKDLQITEALPSLQYTRASIFQDVFVEILHDGEDPNVYIRLYNDGSANGLNWSGFRSASVKFCLLKATTVKYNEYNVKIVKNFEIANACERIECKCEQRRGGFCGVRKLCSVNELLDCIHKKILQVRVPSLCRNCNKMLNQESDYCSSCERRIAPRFENRLHVFLLSRISLAFSVENRISNVVSKLPGVSKVLGNLASIKYDFVLKCEDQLFHCHKFLLAGNSMVFSAMLHAGMTETVTNEMTMDDTTCDAVEAFIDFLYTGNFTKAANDSALAFELLQLGHRYEMEKLQNVMKELFITKPDEDFNTETALQIFAFCCKAGNLEDLKNKAVDMLKSNGDKIADLEGFGEFLKSDPNVVKELFKRMFS